MIVLSLSFIIISLVIIVVVHQIYNYFIEVLTNPKEKNILENSYHQYRDIYDRLYHENIKKKDDKS